MRKKIFTRLVAVLAGPHVNDDPQGLAADMLRDCLRRYHENRMDEAHATEETHRVFYRSQAALALQRYNTIKELNP